jgi:cytochrome c6
VSFRFRRWGAGFLIGLFAIPVFAQNRGEADFKSKCAMCHGVDGLASTPAGKAMKTPSVKSAEFAKLSESEMITSTRDGKGKMPAYKGKLSDAQIREVVTYMRTLDKK